MEKVNVSLYDAEVDLIVDIVKNSNEPLSNFLAHEIVRNTKATRNDYDFLFEFLTFALAKYGDELKNNKGGAVVGFMEDK